NPIHHQWSGFEIGIGPVAKWQCLPAPGYLKLVSILMVDLLKRRIARKTMVSTPGVPFSIRRAVLRLQLRRQAQQQGQQAFVFCIHTDPVLVCCQISQIMSARAVLRSPAGVLQTLPAPCVLLRRARLLTVQNRLYGRPGASADWKAICPATGNGSSSVYADGRCLC